MTYAKRGAVLAERSPFAHYLERMKGSSLGTKLPSACR
jgi:hypothetical protein